MSTTDAVLIGAVDGERALYVGPELREDLPARVLEGLARRRMVCTGQPCPCGAVMPVPNRAARRAALRAGQAVLRVEVAHEPDCPAVDQRLQDGQW